MAGMGRNQTFALSCFVVGHPFDLIRPPLVRRIFSLYLEGDGA